jgi:LPS export ABC transporter protein LptC
MTTRNFQKRNSPTSQRLNFSLTLSVGLLLLSSSCQNDMDEARKITSRANVNIETGKEVTIKYTDHGNIKIKVVAKKVNRFNTEKPYMEFSEGIKLFFFNGKEVETMLTAGYATAVESSNQMTARNNVEVINVKGDKMNTEELIWDSDKKIIYSNTFVKITTADEIIFGDGMVANETFSDYTIKHITGKVKVKASEM